MKTALCSQIIILYIQTKFQYAYNASYVDKKKSLEKISIDATPTDYDKIQNNKKINIKLQIYSN